jgi:molybdopterin-guanine dinucleotide biosynthesis protein A
LISASDSVAEDAAGFVLAGGRSSRMGSDKAFVEVDGEPQIVRALNILRGAGLSLTIAGGGSHLSAYAPMLDDAGFGPLGGICAALASTTAEYAVFLSVDMPLLPPSLISLIVRQARITKSAVTGLSVSGFAQTFPCVMQRAVLPGLQKEREAGNNGCFSALRAAATALHRPFTVLAVENLVQAGQLEHPRSLPAALWFLNVNTPSDLERARSLVAVNQVI